MVSIVNVGLLTYKEEQFEFRVGASQQAVLNVSAKFKNSYLIEQKIDGKGEIYSHLLIGRIKDTPILFSFIL